MREGMRTRWCELPKVDGPFRNILVCGLLPPGI